MTERGSDAQPLTLAQAKHVITRAADAGRLPPLDTLMAAWRTAMKQDGEARQLSASAAKVATLLRLRGLYHEAHAVATDALESGPSKDVATSLRLELALDLLGQGIEPPDLRECVAGALRLADRRLAQGRIEESADLAERGVRALFHRELHTEERYSPLVSHPDQFLGPVRRSKTIAKLSGSRARGIAARRRNRATPSASRSRSSRPTRLLFVTMGNWNFVDGICDHFDAIAGVEVRRLDLSAPGLGIGRSTLELITNRLREAKDGSVPPLPEPLSDLLSWADTIFVDWCDNAALWAVQQAPRTARLVIRLHSVEALSAQPHLMYWDRVADLVFVSDPVRRLTESVVPVLKTLGTRIHVIPNYVQLGGPANIDKADEAGRTVAMVGWSSTVKDPVWATDVLAALRKADDRWRMLLIGTDFPQSLTASGSRYRDTFESRTRQTDVRDALIKIPYTRDLRSLFVQAGFVLSSSRRESFHVSLVEGAASGCIPVVRDWPLLAPFGGPQALFPKEWIVQDVAAAADRILWHTAIPDRMTTAAKEAREYVLGRYDWSVVASQYEKFLLE